MATTSAATPASAWAPLRVRAFRFLWTAQVASTIGTWMQTVGAQWLLVDEPNAPTLVALVQTAMMLPTLLLALPAGALADVFDRRRLLIAMQLFQMVVAAGLTVLTVVGWLPPAVLLTATFLLGCGQTLTVPGYQALVTELVPTEYVRSAAALNGVAMNAARAIGPAIAGLLITQIGVAAIFALNAVSFVVLAGVLVGLRRPPADEPVLPERFTGALLAGTRYVRHSSVVQRLMLRILLFVAPAAALWALLPLVADRLLRLDSRGYGLMMAAVGIGAVIGAWIRPWVAARLTPNQLNAAAALIVSVGMAVCVVVPNFVVVLVVLLPVGTAWLTVLSTMNGTLQLFLPRWVRARGLSIYQMCFAGGQALAALAWGLVAEAFGVVPTLLVAAGMMSAGAASVRLWPLHDVSDVDRNPVVGWPDPELAGEPDPEEGPVLVTRTYHVPPERVPQFLDAMQKVRRMRLRTGAAAATLYRDGADPNQFVETSLYPTWAEHLRQHYGRLTGADMQLDRAATALAEDRPQVQHLFPAWSDRSVGWPA
jgi:MFS family permease